MTEHLTWRQAAAEDTPLLFELFCSNKGEELAPLGLTTEQLGPLLQMQFNARHMSYGSTFPHALDMILCLEDGTPVGRHLIDRQTDCYRSIDLAVLPQHRNRGIGGWAVRQIQQLAQVEGVAMRLRVITQDRAVHLYQRLGFEKIASDEFSFEMEWRPSGMAGRKPAPQKPEAQIALLDGRQIDRPFVLDTILTFVQEIGLTVDLRPIPEGFLPGIRMVRGGLHVDLDTLLYPGDLLHEAGHLAVMPPDRRYADSPAPTTDGSEEMAAIAWSYAAALHLGLPPEVVFHEHGYKGQAQSLIARYQGGDQPGVPMLWWMDLTTRPIDGQPSAYPRMTRWLRANTSPEPSTSISGLAGQEQAEEVHA